MGKSLLAKCVELVVAHFRLLHHDDAPGLEGLKQHRPVGGRKPDGTFNSHAFAAYPPALCLAIAQALHAAHPHKSRLTPISQPAPSPPP